MQRISVKVIGTGVEGDAFRVNLPTYNMVEIDYGTMVAIVDVPDADIPLVVRNRIPVLRNVAGKLVNVRRTQAGDKALFEQVIKGRYPEGYSNFNADTVLDV